ncbi:hypothetical protein B5V02_21030 [Mesorhizobium kowhaii]|uniref:Uncharacterized protein n=1 Tax=Mesorhizobium kowhaii TaxID=1300272 RepID=A0A2W7CJ25_9HYPH|nr:hypothetical protein B5V02_21030 [Mesorhizobium kowhaii]
MVSRDAGAPLVVYNRPRRPSLPGSLARAHLIEADYELASSEMVLRIGDGLRLACAAVGSVARQGLARGIVAH